MSNIDDYYVKMTKIPQVSQQGVALNAFELADTKEEGIEALPEFTEQKRIVPADESLNLEELKAVTGSSELSPAGVISKPLSEKQKRLGAGFLAYLLFKFLK